MCFNILTVPSPWVIETYSIIYSFKCLDGSSLCLNELQVNQELKKLLVASVGDDLQHRVERLTR